MLSTQPFDRPMRRNNYEYTSSCQVIDADRGAVARIYATHAFDVRNHVTQVRNPHTYTVMWQWTDHEPIALPITTQSLADAMTKAQRVWDRIK